MTKLLSFAEWVAEQKKTDVAEVKEGCNEWVCALADEAYCLTKRVGYCPLKRAYDNQRAQDLKKWEKWNSERR